MLIVMGLLKNHETTARIWDGKHYFIHAGIDEDAGEEWKWESTDRDYLEKFPRIK